MTTKFTAQTFAWMRQVNTDRHLLAIDLKVAVELTRYFREKDQNGRAYPAAKTLADAVGLSERSVRRSIDRLHRTGHLYVIPGKPGRGCSAQYWMVLKTGTATPVFDGQKTGTRDRQKTGIRGKKTGTAAPEILREPMEDGECYALPHPLGERDRAARDAISSDRGGALDAPARSFEDHGPIERPIEGRDPKESADEENEIAAEAVPPPNGAAALVVLDQERGWRELRDLWQRGWASDDTPKAQAIARQGFVKACREVAPGEILEGARTWIAAADAPRYLPALAQWLEARGWEKPPPKKRKRAASNDRRSYRKGKPDLMRIALKMGGYVEDEEGKLYHPDGEVGSSFDWRASL